MAHGNYLISNQPNVFLEMHQSIQPERLNYFDGAGFPSFSKLVNTCVASCPYETVIIMSDKIKPKASDVGKILTLLDQGYAFVALYRFAFFGFRKQLMRQIGMMDERYNGGWYEDDDFYIRLVESNMPIYITHEAAYTKGASRWKHPSIHDHFAKKWVFDPASNTLTRAMPEEQYAYNLGPDVPVNFLPGRAHSYVPLPNVAKYFYIEIK